MVSRLITYFCSLVLVCALALQAQEKPKPEPPKTDAPLPPSELKNPVEQKDTSSAPELPKIDLPEYVITGIISIDLPEVEKEESEEYTDRLAIMFKDPVSEHRDRETIELNVSDKEALLVPNLQAFWGRLAASTGTYFTSRLGFWLGHQDPEFTYLGQADYHVTRGYVPFSNRSGGNIDLKGGMLLHSPSSVFDQMTLGGNAGYGSETYRFYGSSVPSTMRTKDRIGLGISLTSAAGAAIDYSIALNFKSLGLKDSSSKATENQASVAAWFNIPAWSETLIGSIQFANASLSGAASANLPYLDIGLASSKIWWNKFFVQPALHFYYGEGMLRQKLTALYPQISLGYRLANQTTLIASYRGEVRRTTLSGQLELYPYLSAQTLLRHTNLQADIVGAIETDWSEVWRTRFSARYQSVREYPLYDDPLKQGVGTFVFAGRTRITTYQADIFAKFAANSYFTVSVAVNSTKNLITNAKIPYVADFELSAMWRHTFPFRLSVIPRANFVDRRNVDVFSGANTPEYWLFGVRAEYPILEQLDAFVDLDNILDRKYDDWRGYRATPFLMQAGLSFRW